MHVLTKVGVEDDWVTKQKDPWEFRWDVMYNFANEIFFSLNELEEHLENLFRRPNAGGPQIQLSGIQQSGREIKSARAYGIQSSGTGY